MAREADPALSRYITRVKDIPQLSREEEHDLAVRVRDHGDADAAEALVRANLRYVVAIAITYRRYDVGLGDLVSEGHVGLVTAVRKFDPEKGTRFVTYAAYWIRAFVLNAVIKGWSMVGSGSGPLRSKLFFRLRRERARMASMVSVDDSAMDTLAAQMGTTRARLDEMFQRLDARDVSLDAPAHDDAKSTALDMLADDHAPQDELVDERDRTVRLDGRVQQAMRALDQRERFIVEQRLMSDEEMSLAEIGRRMGISRERARQLEVRARKKLQRSLGDLGPSVEPTE